MSWLSPVNLAWLGLLAPLVLLYVLKRRRTTRVVSSTLLWAEALRDLRAERPWRRLVPHVSLIVQVLALTAGAFALARPVGEGAPPRGAVTVAVVDVSASMAVKAEDGRSRLEAARAVLADLAATLPPGGALGVVEASDTPSVRTAATSDGALLASAIRSLSVRGVRANIRAAVELAGERLRGASPGSRIVILTDGAEDGQAEVAAPVPVEVRHVGEASDNTGIVALDVRPLGGMDGRDRAEVFVRVARHARAPADVFVTARSDAGRTLASRRLRLPREGTESLVMALDLPPDAAGRAPLVRVSLAPADSEEGALDDALALDDVAVAPSPGAARLPVFLVGQNVPALERLVSSDPRVLPFATTLEKLAAAGDEAPRLEGLPIYIGETPEEPPEGLSLVIHPTGEEAFGVPFGPSVKTPGTISWAENDPRMRFVSMADVHLFEARPIGGSSVRPLLVTDAGPVIAVLERASGETVFISFDPAQSDWARDPSFVVFFRNLLLRARAIRAQGGIPEGALGEPLRVPAPDGTRVTVEGPDGSTRSAVARGGVALVPVPPVPGVYRADVSGRTRYALRNLLDPGETNPRRRLEIRARGSDGAELAAVEVSHREAWPWLVLFLLLLLVFDAWWATRRAER